MSAALRHYLQLVASHGLRVPLGVLNVALLARLLGPDGMGQWALVLATATALHSVLVSWSQAAGLRYGREEWVRGATVRQTWGGRWPWVLGGLVAAAGILAIDAITPLGRVVHVPATWWPLVLAQVVALWAMAETQTLQQVTSQWGRLAVFPLATAVISVTVLYLLSREAPRPASAVTIGAVVGTSLAVWVVAWGWEVLASRAGFPRPAGLARAISYGWPMIPSFLVGYLSDWGDHLLLQMWFPPREVGLFQSAYQTMLLTVGLAAPLTTLLTPRLIDANIHEPAAERRYLSEVFPTIALIWMVGIIPVVALLPLVFRLVMGPGFAAAEPVLLVLLALVPGAVITHMYSVLFTLQARLRRTLLFLTVMTGTNLALSLLLIPRYGPLGAGGATAVSYGVSQFLYMRDQHAFVGVNVRPMLRLFLAGWSYGLAVAWVGGALLPRMGLTLLALGLLVHEARRQRLPDRRVVDALLPTWLEPAARRWAGAFGRSTLE